jgi:hypothetical protein
MLRYSVRSVRLRPVHGPGHALRNLRCASSTAKDDTTSKSTSNSDSAEKKERIEKLKKYHKSMAEADEEMRRAMEALAGDGGEAGLELEDGKAVSMKRGVRENMFRYI